MALGFATAVRNAQLTAIADAINAGSGPGKVRIYSGSRPATGGTATTLLAELTLSDPCQASITGGVLTFDTVTSDTSADATGTATWFRIVDSDNAFVADGSVGTSGADLNMNTVSFTAGQSVGITSMVWTMGGA